MISGKETVMKKILGYAAAAVIIIALLLWLIGALFQSSFLLDTFMSLIFGFLEAVVPLALAVLGIAIIIKSVFR